MACAPKSKNSLPGHREGPWELLARAAERLGFVAAGAAPAGPVPAAARRAYDQWIAAGNHGSMGFLVRHAAVRADPRHARMVSSAEAVVSVALPYGNGTDATGLWQHVAAHARARDYHATMKQRLGELANTIERGFPGSRSRVFVDSGPVMERAWAVAAGLGSIGRHGGLLVRGVGARVVLGEVICAGVPAPKPANTSERFAECATCDLCLAACPTAAIVEPGIVDARRCLSYHTIENHAPRLPPEIAVQVSTIFGCDECTRACPLEDQQPACALEPIPSPGAARLGPAELLELDDATIAKMIAGTCLERTGVAAIRRNASLVASRSEIASGELS
jgi:epoxyqueuosine reductase